MNFYMTEEGEASRKAFGSPAFERGESSAATAPRVSAPFVRMPCMITYLASAKDEFGPN